jgi:two-component sensor histidine kinase
MTLAVAFLSRVSSKFSSEIKEKNVRTCSENRHQIRNALQMLSALADQCAEEEKKVVFRDQIRQIERKLN